MIEVPHEIAPVINREALILRIGAFLRSKELSDPFIARTLLEEAQISLIQAGQAIEYWRRMCDQAIHREP